MSLYQALYPKKYDAAFPQGDASLKQLVPFRKSKAEGDFYTSAHALVRDYNAPGFAVPGGDIKPSDNMREAIKLYLLKTYYW